MKTRDVALLCGLGLAIWMLGTVFYAYQGPAVLETTRTRYWTSLVLSPVLSGAICIAILRWRHIPAVHWAAAMLLLAIPGMIGEAAVLSHLGAFVPRLREASVGRYGALLFATYGVVLTLAELVTLRATP